MCRTTSAIRNYENEVKSGALSGREQATEFSPTKKAENKLNFMTRIVSLFALDVSRIAAYYEGNLARQQTCMGTVSQLGIIPQIGSSR